MPKAPPRKTGLAQFEERAPLIAGVTRVDESRLRNENSQELNALKSCDRIR